MNEYYCIARKSLPAPLDLCCTKGNLFIIHMWMKNIAEQYNDVNLIRASMFFNQVEFILYDNIKDVCRLATNNSMYSLIKFSLPEYFCTYDLF